MSDRHTPLLRPVRWAVLALILLTLPLAAQHHKHYISLGGGGLNPGGDLGPYFRASPLFGFGYGYRFARHLQLDTGLDTVFRAANVRDFLQTEVGPLRIRDYQFVVPMGGRAILPVAGERILIHGGGGAAYMKYTELLRQPSDFFRVQCPPCSNRSGWGWYAQAGFSMALDQGGHFRVGASVKSYRGHTDGRGLGTLPGIRTSDRWIGAVGNFSFSF